MEYFFDYKIRRISGDPEIAQPMLFFERNYRATGLPYSMFAVVDDWIGKQKEHERLVGGDRKALDALKFDELKVRFVPFGASFDDVEKSSANETECNFDEYCSEGCRFKIAADDPSSGTGSIRMFKKGKEVAKFCFAVNLAMRRRVGCRLKRKNDKLVCVLTCKNAKDKFAVAAIGNSGRLPCLDVDRADPTDETKVVDLVSKSRARVVFDLGDSPKDMKFSLTFADAEGCLDAETAKKYYLLDIFENNTVEIVHPKTEFILNYSCPFCHKRMNVDLVKDARYRHGCITCDGAESVHITNGSGKEMACAEDSEQNEGAIERLLPHDYLGHDSFKIGFMGSARAGKTTYISRFFDLDYDGSVTHINMEMAKKSLAVFGIDIESAPIRKLQPIREGDRFEHTIETENWTDRAAEYADRAISLKHGKFPGMTVTGKDYFDFPFIAEVNGKTYAAFYDIAGEDSQKEVKIRNIAEDGDVVGIFCVINGKADPVQNQHVFNKLTEAHLDRRCPLAIIVAKMDTLEDKFDSNCHCLRTDYFDSGKGRYDGSLLEWEIDYSSAEIESYLIDAGLMPELGDNFENVKFFGVSAFNFDESIHSLRNTLNKAEAVRFECSAKRLELPFIWMLRQFSVIK